MVSCHSCILLAGMPFTSGLRSRSEVVASVDAPPLTLLKKAGAIPLVTTNTSELCMWFESHNHLHGVTKNPYDLERIPGGSSGQLRLESVVLLMLSHKMLLASFSLVFILSVLCPPQEGRAVYWGRRAQSSGSVQTSAGAFAYRLSSLGYLDIKPLLVRQMIT